MLQGNPLEQLSDVRKLSHSAHVWLSRRHIKSFYAAMTTETLRLGVQSMLQVAATTTDTTTDTTTKLEDYVGA